ncbi:MAG: beta strand repeat-containing protein [Gemmobacter sp.]
MATQNITLDGITSFNAFGSTGNWSDANINYISVGIDPGQDPAEDNTLNADLAGGAWRIRYLNLFNDGPFDYDINLTDANDGVFRRIERLQISGQGDAVITLFDTRVRFLEVFDDRTLNLTLGTQRLNYMASDGRLNVINMGSGEVSAMRLGSGDRESDNTINGGAGYIGALAFLEGSTNTINNGGNFGAIRSDGNVNNFTFVSGGDELSLGSGVSHVNLTGGFYGAITSNGGTNTVTVGADAFVRSIGFSNGIDIITVAGGAEQVLTGDNDDTVTVTGRVDSLMLGSGNNLFTLDGEWTWAVTAFSGNDTVSVNQGQIDQLYLGGGNNVITLGNGAFVGSIRVNEGADRLTLNGGDVQQAALGSGANTVIVNGGGIDQLTTFEGNDRVTITSGRINWINVSDGDNRVVTGDEWTSAITAYDGRDAIIIGSGGTGAIQVGGGRNIVTTTTGFVDYINTQNDADTITIGSGGALTVVTSGGNDRINAAAGRVDFVDAGGGGDIVALGAGGARFVVLGDGNDTINVAAFNPNFGVEIQGDAGIDTLAFTGFDTGVTFSLNVSDWQNPGAPGGDPNAVGTGYVAAISVENLTGSGGSDSLTGDNFRNVLIGNVGNDTLNGLDGNDRLIGGRQSDLLFGGAGRDVFVFNPNEGIDRIGDFQQGLDTIELLAANDISELAFQQVGSDVRIVFQQNTIFVADTTVAVMNDIDNFVF